MADALNPFGTAGEEEEEDYRSRDDQARRELEQVMLQIDQTTDKSLESTRSMLRMTNEATNTGAATLTTLNEQGDQIKRVETRLDEAHEEVQATTKNLDQLEKCCGCCILPWNLGGKRKQHSKTAKYDDINVTDEKRREKEAKKEAKKKAKEAKKKGKSPELEPPAEHKQEEYIQRITNDEREDEMNRNLNEVHGMVLGLKAMGTDMYNEVDKQNKDLDRIAEKTVTLDDEVHLADKRAKKIVRKM